MPDAQIRRDDGQNLLVQILSSLRKSTIGHPISPTGGVQRQIRTCRRFARVMFHGGRFEVTPPIEC